LRLQRNLKENNKTEKDQKFRHHLEKVVPALIPKSFGELHTLLSPRKAVTVEGVAEVVTFAFAMTT
jgi:hypothetical protein